jgi:hypothetical protein
LPIAVLSSAALRLAGLVVIEDSISWHRQLEAFDCRGPGAVLPKSRLEAGSVSEGLFTIARSPELAMLAPVMLQEDRPMIVREPPESLGIGQLLSIVPVTVTVPTTSKCRTTQGARQVPAITRSWLTFKYNTPLLTVTPAGTVTDRKLTFPPRVVSLVGRKSGLGSVSLPPAHARTARVNPEMVCRTPVMRTS